MSIQETFPYPPDDLFNWADRGSNKNRSRTAMSWMYDLWDTMNSVRHTLMDPGATQVT